MNPSVFSYIICIVLIILIIIVTAIKDDNLQNQINKLKITNCGLIQYEDYSVGPQENDAKIIKCVLEIKE